MAVFLVNLCPRDIEQIEQLVSSGSFRDVEQFLAVAIRNQLVYEATGATFKIEGSKSAAIPDGKSPHDSQLRDFSLGRNAKISSDANGNPSQDPLWGQYYRFLPLKSVLRLILNEFGGSPFLLEDSSNLVRTHIMSLVSLVDYLRKHGPARGPRMNLQVGLPSTKRDLGKSLDRFIVQYVGRYTSDGRLTGFPSDMGFLAGDDGENHQRIKLTAPGLTLGCMSNPVLDQEEDPSPLSADEAHFILEYIGGAMPGEAAQISEIVHLISEGTCNPASLDKALRAFYVNTGTNKGISAQECALMRSGCISRLSELGAVIRRKEKGQMIYSLTPNYTKMLKGVFSAKKCAK